LLQIATYYAKISVQNFRRYLPNNQSRFVVGYAIQYFSSCGQACATKNYFSNTLTDGRKRNTKRLAFPLILLVLLAWTSGFYIGELSEKQNTETVTDTVTVVTDDTIHSLQPVEVVRYVYRTKVDTLRTTDSVLVAVEIPIETAQFTDTSIKNTDTICYNAFVSGYQPMLDSIHFSYSKHETTITNTIVQKPKRWHWGITGGYFVGYDISHRQMSNGLGVCLGMTYTFKSPK
jgi:hypothetical protein